MRIPSRDMTAMVVEFKGGATTLYEQPCRIEKPRISQNYSFVAAAA